MLHEVFISGSGAEGGGGGGGWAISYLGKN